MKAAVPDVILAAGQFFFGAGKVRLHTLLGTCVAITLWNPVQRLGGMCHYLLPRRGANQAITDGAPGLYAVEVMELFVAKLHETATAPVDYIVSAMGGGNMFTLDLTDADCIRGECREAHRLICQSIGCQNICIARQLLAAHGFTIAMENIGGLGSRQVTFDLETGLVSVKRGAALAMPPTVTP